MRQAQQNNRRGRGRGRKAQNPLTKNYESNGPDVKIRGTAAHISEKYNALARDALSSSDIVRGENYLQHAEHYNRIIMAAQQQNSSDDDQADDGASSEANAKSNDQRDHSGGRENSGGRDNSGGNGQSNSKRPENRKPNRRRRSEKNNNNSDGDQKSGEQKSSDKVHPIDASNQKPEAKPAVEAAKVEASQVETNADDAAA